MIKCKLITSGVPFDYDDDLNNDALDGHDEEIHSAIEHISEEGHAFISMNTTNFILKETIFLRTEIVYRENQTRKVLVEKS